MDEYSETYDQYVKITYRLHFFNSCKSKKIIPTGLTIEQNLATHVNDEDFISECKKSCIRSIKSWSGFSYREI